jgi:hypothetical protein
METLIAALLIAGNLVAIGAHLEAGKPAYPENSRAFLLSAGGFFLSIGSMGALIVFGAPPVLGMMLGVTAVLSFLGFFVITIAAGSEA